MLLELENIVKCYGGRRALNGVSARLDEGRIVGLLGPNGAGKSTLMKIITGYISADEGVVRIDGMDVERECVRTKALVGYLPEHNPLYKEMYVREYLNFVAGMYGMRGMKRREAVDAVLVRTGMGDECGKRIGELSKGYRQRVGIAAAIIHNPRLLILDEPTTGLDPNQLIEIRGLIEELGRERLVIFSTHIMQEVEMICDDVMVMNHGEVVVRGTKEELLGRFGSMEEIFRNLDNL